MISSYVTFFRDEALCKCQTCIIWKILNSHLFHYITGFSPAVEVAKYMMGFSHNLKKCLGVENVSSPAAQLI